MRLVVDASITPEKREQARQLAHWRLAAHRLAAVDDIAPALAWEGLEHYLGVSLRTTLEEAARRLETTAVRLEQELHLARSDDELRQTRVGLLRLRRLYLRTEATLDFFAEALATRAVPRAAALLRACDHIATRCMAEALSPLGRQVPAALSYYTKGVGAAIIKAGARLWEGHAENPVAAIRVARHHALRSTAIVHEAGHMVAHMLGWNRELSERLRATLSSAPPAVAGLWASTSSELAADGFAFAHTGYASVAGLHDVVDGEPGTAFVLVPGDPHPMPYLRVLLWARAAATEYGEGPWDALAEVWRKDHPVAAALPRARQFIDASLPLLPAISDTILHAPCRAFDGRSLAQLISPQKVSPAALARLESDAGRAAFTSPYWIWNEAIRLLALNGYRAGTDAAGVREAARRQEELMLKLGALKRAA
jgi:hypothetical protein